MDVKECVQSVHQCSEFEKKKIPVETIYNLIESATYAPCAGEMECWEFVVVDDKKILGKISNQCPKQEWIKEAPSIIIILRSDERVKTLYKDKGEYYSIQSCAAAAQSIILRALDLGLGTYWIRHFNDKGIARILDIPSEEHIELMIAVGHPKDKHSPEVSRISVDKITHFNKY